MINRRTFLEESWLAVLVAAGQWSFRLRGCDASRGATGSAPPIPDGALCGGTTAPSAAAHTVRALLRPETLARFVDPLPIPPVLAPEGTRPDPDDPTKQIPFYRVVMRQENVRLHRDLPPTQMWTYAGVMPGPTIETRSGQGILVEWVNALPQKHFLPIDHTLHGAHADQPEARAVVHLHGARVAPESDGYPEAWYPPGQSRVSHYPTAQDATMLWYHDHTRASSA